MWFSLLGLAVTVSLNVILVPVMGYMGCAWAAFCCYGVMMLSSYLIGRMKHPLRYPLRSIGGYTLLAAVFYTLGMYVAVTPWAVVNYVIRGILIAAYVIFVIRNERLSLPGMRWILPASKSSS